MVRLTIDGKEFDAASGITLLEACEQTGAEIPRFCYHERLSIAGNCRMCLVEVEKLPKLAASCALPVAEGMVVHTGSERVREARRGVMEFLLINHPLDCPICDQGGECDLQDQALAYGLDRSRFRENKRAVENKDMGPLIKTEMTRCIHCTRCVRFASEVAGAPEIGSIGRGEDMEIVPYLEQVVTSELSGNMIDLCPVGALTSRPYAFTARPWELRKTGSIDVMDAAGAHIRIDARGREVMRILPRLNEAVNEEWITDKARFIYDGLKSQRLDRPYLREDGELRPASWEEAFAAIAQAVKKTAPERMAALAGGLACVESLKALKDLMQALGAPHMDCRESGAPLGGSPLGGPQRGGYLFNSTIAGIEEADAALLIGAAPRLEAPLIEARLRKRWRMGPFPAGSVGAFQDFTWPVEQLGEGAQTLEELAAGKHEFARRLGRAKHPLLILGMGALARPGGEAVYRAALNLAWKTGAVGNGWNGFNILHMSAGQVGGLDMNFLPGRGGQDFPGIFRAARAGRMDFVYLLHADEIDAEALKKAFVVYQGSHGDAGAQAADVILPGAAWTEKNAFWVNTEGRVQEAMRAVFPPGDAREDWQILRALSESLGKPLPYDDSQALREAIIADAPHFAAPGEIAPPAPPPPAPGRTSLRSCAGPFAPLIEDYYLTNPIARASRIMAACSRARSRAR